MVLTVPETSTDVPSVIECVEVIPQSRPAALVTPPDLEDLPARAPESVVESCHWTASEYICLVLAVILLIIVGAIVLVVGSAFAALYSALYAAVAWLSGLGPALGGAAVIALIWGAQRRVSWSSKPVPLAGLIYAAPKPAAAPSTRVKTKSDKVIKSKPTHRVESIPTAQKKAPWLFRPRGASRSVKSTPVRKILPQVASPKIEVAPVRLAHQVNLWSKASCGVRLPHFGVRGARSGDPRCPQCAALSYKAYLIDENGTLTVVTDVGR